MNILVIGATGYIGSAITKALRSANYEVTGLARSPSSAQKLEALGARSIPGDLNQLDQLFQAVQQVDAVIYAAATNDATMAETEKAAVETCLKALSGSQKRFIYTSSTWLLGNCGDTIADETTPLNPTSFIAWRSGLEQLVMAAGDRQIHSVIIRPTLAYGHGGGIVGMLVQGGKQEGVVKFVGDGESRWTLAHVDDLARCYVAALEKAPAGSLFIAADQQVVKLKDIAAAASVAAGIPGKAQAWPLVEARSALGEFADALALDLQVSGAKAREILGWQPQAAKFSDDIKVSY